MRLRDAETALEAAREEAAVLRDAVALREAFIAAIGHELRNPMVPILLSVERLQKLSASGDLRRLPESIAVLGQATDAFMRRAEQLLDISRLGNTGFLLPCAPADVTAIVQDTAERHREIARRAGCGFTIDLAPSLRADTHQAGLEQLLDNLLSNAFKYGAGRPVLVRLRRLEDCAELAVIDQGHGIDTAEQHEIFLLFRRARETAAPGLGIGLWIASRLAAALGGDIAVASAPGKGAAFTVRLPLERPADEENPCDA